MIISGKDIIFLLQNEDIQNEAIEKINRRLTEEELYQVKKGIEFGLEDWPEIVHCAIDNLVK